MSETKRCKNCNSELAGLYCNQCGQKDTELLSLMVIVREFTNNVFSFDSRFFITLKYLIIKPGFLTTEYWEGKRTTYLPPLRLYLVLSVLYFFIISMVSDDTSVFSKISHSNSDNEIDRNSGIIRIDESEPQIFHYFVDIINKGIIKTKEQNLSFNDIVFNTLPRAMFILMPFMGVLLLLLYKKNKIFYSYHFIAVLHFHCFVFFVSSIEELIPFVEVVLPVFFLYYSLSMLKRIYQNSWMQTSIKFILLVIIYGTSVMLTQVIILFGKIILLGFSS